MFKSVLIKLATRGGTFLAGFVASFAAVNPEQLAQLEAAMGVVILITADVFLSFLKDK